MRIDPNPALALSRVAVGTMNIDRWGPDAQRRADWLRACADLGVTTVDHADIYGDHGFEAELGDALAHAPGLRSRLQLVGKCGIRTVSPARPHHRIKSYDTSRAHIVSSVESSLRALRTDYLDLLLLHRPSPLLDADEVAGTFSALAAAGKVRAFGVSNFGPGQLELLDSREGPALVAHQLELSLGHTRALYDGTLDQCQRLRIAPMAWAPLQGGHVLTDETKAGRRIRIGLGEIGEELGGAGLDAVALAFVLHHPTRPIPVLGTRRLERVRAAVQAVELPLSDEQWFRLLRAAEGHDVP